ncbi:MAG: substrate-binding domain-containing protein [Treponemataceae bacterium]
MRIFSSHHHQKLSQGKTLDLLYINGQLGHPVQINRRIGFMDEIKKLGYTVNIVAEDTGNWGAGDAQQKMDTWLAVYKGQFNLIIAQNDGWH